MGRVTDTISGSLATFRTPGKQQIRSLKAYFTPKQEGEGTPSPDNVRPISGWTGVEVYKAGKNVFPNANGTSAPLNLKAGTVITASTSANSGGYFRGQNASGEHVTPVVWLNKTDESGRRMTAPYTLPEDVSTGFIFLSGGVDEAQITLDGSVTYEPYQGTTFPIDWTSAGTVYGGYVDLVTGEVWAEYGIFEPDENSYITVISGNTYKQFRFQNAPYIKSRNAGYCSHFTMTANPNVYGVTGMDWLNQACQLILQNDSTIYMETVAELKAWLTEQRENGTPFQIVYAMTEPVLVTTLTPTALRTLIGTNNIWCNSGDVSVEYDFAESREMQEARKRVMAFDAAKRDGLPFAYLRVDYLESDGTQYIETDINCPSEIVAYQTLTITNNRDQYGWGNRSGGYQICGFGQYSKHLQMYYGNNYKWNWGDGLYIEIGHKYKTKQIYKDGYQTYYVDGVQYGTCDFAQNNKGIGDTILLFKARGSGIVAYMRLHYIRFMNANETVKLGEFIPCIRKSDSKPGMYDTVTKTFYTNAGTGEFIIPT